MDIKIFLKILSVWTPCFIHFRKLNDYESQLYMTVMSFTERLATHQQEQRELRHRNPRLIASLELINSELRQMDKQLDKQIRGIHVLYVVLKDAGFFGWCCMVNF